MSKLFGGFDPVSSKAWKQKIQVDLKGADYNQALVWNAPEGISVKPFYHPDQFERPFDPVPGQPAYWEIVQSVYVDQPGVAGKLMAHALDKGAEALEIRCDKEFDPKEAFDGVELNDRGIHLRPGMLDKDFTAGLLSYLKARGARAYLNLDLIGNLCRSGNWFHNKEKDHQVLDSLLEEFADNPILGVDSGLFQNAGANIVQQLAYALAIANEYLIHLGSRKGRLTFSVAVGGNYFFEIAKIRALRKLYASLAKEYGQSQTCSVIATPSRRNKTLYDYNMNMLRTTTECMSAVLGGANAVCNMPYDAIYHKSNAFGERIARNQLLILKSESYFGQVNNPVDGTYYIESLTDELAEKALDVFKQIEKGGGFLAQLMEGTIQRKIREQADAEQKRFDEQERVLVGTNKYQNPDDRMKDDLELYPFVKKAPRKTLIEPIIEKRLAERLEQERLQDE